MDARSNKHPASSGHIGNPTSSILLLKIQGLYWETRNDKVERLKEMMSEETNSFMLEFRETHLSPSICDVEKVDERKAEYPFN